MRKQLIYDLPTRIFHWAFAILFVTAFMIAKTIDDDNPVFSYHMLAGLMLGGLVTLRLIWGLVGTKYARFSSFALHPADLIAYGKGIFTGDKTKWAGHNPASSWGTLAMLAFAAGLAITGYLMSTGSKETFEDVHELLANGFLITVLFHIAGVLLHALRHQDGIALTMVHGKKEEVENEAPISGSKPVVALLFVVLIATYGAYLAKNYDAGKRQLNFFGTTLQLGENEEGESEGGTQNEESEHEHGGNEGDHDDDDD